MSYLFYKNRFGRNNQLFLLDLRFFVQFSRSFLKILLIPPNIPRLNLRESNAWVYLIEGYTVGARECEKPTFL